MPKPSEPRRTCPTCRRPNLCVVRRSERMRPHDRPDGGECAGSWAVIDLYADEA